MNVTAEMAMKSMWMAEHAMVSSGLLIIPLVANAMYMMTHRLISDIDECRRGTSPCGQVCYNAHGSYRCSCYPGFKLDSNNMTCSGKNAIHRQYWIFKMYWKMSNGLIAGWYPVTMVQHRLPHILFSFSIPDINECVLNLHDCQHICINTLGGYECGCHPGFQLNVDKRSCDGEVSNLYCYTMLWD